MATMPATRISQFPVHAEWKPEQSDNRIQEATRRAYEKIPEDGLCRTESRIDQEVARDCTEGQEHGEVGGHYDQVAYYERKFLGSEMAIR
jgi:hypothetical protein